VSIDLLASDAVARATACGLQTPPVYVIDDNAELRKSLFFLLATFRITAWSFAAAEDFLHQQEALTPGPILLDLRMPGRDGIDTLIELRRRDVTWPVIVMSAHGDIPIAVKAIKLGAIEFLEKPFGAAMLDDAVTRGFNMLEKSRRAFIAQCEARTLLKRLSPREQEVLALLVEGLPNKVVAHRIALSTRTIEMHRRNALAKLGVRTIAEVVRLMRAVEPSVPVQ